MRKWMSAALAAVIFLSSLPQSVPDAMARTGLSWDGFGDIIGSHSIDKSIPAYREYLAQNPQVRPDSEIILEAAAFTRFEDGGVELPPELASNYNGMPGVSVRTGETSLIEFDFSVAHAGLYDILVEYFPIPVSEGGKGSPIQRSIFINGRLPYRELALVEFSRVWKNKQAHEAAEKGAAAGTPLSWERDNQDNDLKPHMQETPEWMAEYVYDSGGYVSRPLSVSLAAGTHTLSLFSQREPMFLRRIVLHNRNAVPSYADTLAAWDLAGGTDTSGRRKVIEAEYAARTSSQMLYPMQDQSSPAVSPSSPKLLLNNSIGGNSWRMPGQWIEWDFQVEETGYYELTMHARQNFKRGAYSSRRITIDGEVPFAEMESYPFNYARNWGAERLENTDGVPFKFFLEAGKTHTIRMEAVMGDYAEIISVVRDAVYDLNAIYRKVISLTGITPDAYADYQVERSFPELTGEMVAVREQLNWALDEITRVSGRGKLSERERVLITMRDQLDILIRNNERFPRNVSSFRVNIRACGTWLNDAMLQPLQLDTLYFHSHDEPIKIKRSGFWSQLGYEFSRLFYSFIIDYNMIGSVSDGNEGETIVLWVGSGRDQANIVKSLIDEWFTRSTGINVNIMLVDMSTLLQASMAGQGPDVAIQVGGELPMNFGVRGSVADLSQFEGFDEVRARFPESAMTPYEYGGKTYALPETQIFPMMFYRKDILSELGIDLPQTWDDVATVMSELAFNQMEFGMIPNEQIFTTLLYQQGGDYYHYNENNDAIRSALDKEEAITAFRQYTEFYTDYTLDRATSVEERFRTGETPIIIADYTFYNLLQVSALELRGIWGMHPIPGRWLNRSEEENEVPAYIAAGKDFDLLEDGRAVDRSASSNGGGVISAFSVFGGVGGSGGACVMMDSTDKKEQVWKFMDWWTSAETQVLFAREMESLMGPAARIPTANIEAFSNLPWPAADYQMLQYQYRFVRGIPQVPGGYFTFRNVNNAFYAVTTPASDRPAGRRQTIMPREALMDRVILINDEIRNKRTEFGLPLE